MAKVKGPLFGLEARGVLGKTICYQRGQGGNQVHINVDKNKSGTIAQLTVRGKYKAGVEAWNALDPYVKTLWEELAKGKPATGFNLYMKDYMKTAILIDSGGGSGILVSKDNFLYKYVPGYNGGSRTFININRRDLTECRPLLTIDLSGEGIPAGATMKNCILHFYQYENYMPGEPCQVYCCNRTGWEEMTSCWNDWKTGSAWTAPGGDFEAAGEYVTEFNWPVSSDTWAAVDIKKNVQWAVDNNNAVVDLILKMKNVAPVVILPGKIAGRTYPVGNCRPTLDYQWEKYI